MRRISNPIPILFVVFTSFSVVSAFAEEAQPQTLVQGPLENDFFVAPDFKFTEVDGRFANLAGVYGGWLIDRKLLLGGGGYFLTNRSDDLKMTYGGFVLEYFLHSDRLVNFSIKGLVGGGQATIRTGLGRTLPLDVPGFLELGDRWGAEEYRNRSRFPISVDAPALEPIDEGFFIAEPEANVMLNITEKIRLGFGGGYRFIGAAGRANDRLEGFTANAALKFAF